MSSQRIYRLLPLLLFIFFFGACKKSTRLNQEYFMFGVSYPECNTDCSQFFLIDNGKLFEDDFDKVRSNNRNGLQTNKFSRKKMAEEDFKLAEQLLDELPVFLMDKSGQRFGCPGCHDQGALYIEYKRKGQKLKAWSLDTDHLEDLPVELRAYSQKMSETLSILLQKQ